MLHIRLETDNFSLLQLRDAFVIHQHRGPHAVDFARVSVKVLLDSNAVANEPRDFVCL